MDWLMGVCVGGGIESSTQDSRCNLWGKNVDKFCFDASGSLFFNCNGYKADPIEWNRCVEDRDSTRDWEGVRKQRDYLIFTSSEEWMPSLMFSSIHTNSSSSSSVCGTLYRPPSPSHWLCFFYPEMNCIPNEGQQISITVQEQSHKKHRYKEVMRDCRGSVHPLAALVHKFNSGDRWWIYK